MPKVYLTLHLIGSPSFQREVGPFDSATFTDELVVDGGSPCATFSGGVWTITDGAALGDSGLTNATASIIFGQAKSA
jgi:hypothetical protein